MIVIDADCGDSMRVDDSRLTAAYLLASKRHGTLYLGSTLDLLRRMDDHREGRGGSFTAKYGVTRLVWYAPFMLLAEARAREYEMKKWRRALKINLIERDNPDWDDLIPSLSGARLPTRVIAAARGAGIPDLLKKGRLTTAPIPGLGEAQVRGPLPPMSAVEAPALIPVVSRQWAPDLRFAPSGDE